MYGTCTCNENELKKNNIYINYYEHVLLQVYALQFMQRNMAVIYCL